MNPNYSLAASRAEHICEYCRAPEAIFNLPFEVSNTSFRFLAAEAMTKTISLYLAVPVISLSQILFQPLMKKLKPKSDFLIRAGTIGRNILCLIRKQAKSKAKSLIAQATISRLRINNDLQLAARVQWLKLGFFD